MASVGQLSLKGRALRLLSAREHSRAELERKLAALEETPGQLARILDELQQRGFISEQRVVDSVIHRRAERIGTARIRQELQSKGLDPVLVQEAVATLQGSELERARAVLHKKFANAAADPATRARQMRFLAGRGFGGEVIQKLIREPWDDAA